MEHWLTMCLVARLKFSLLDFFLNVKKSLKEVAIGSFHIAVKCTKKFRIERFEFSTCVMTQLIIFVSIL